ncbi:LysR substrate-binding domain-containing protein [Horticoccus sp. 23ND18S-11]|uniref:LysR substrate-binding domain-containing protein n=1 Tax=Horticoccus sp. 23ND18S-11 TaxID=3391832 RepID=UPI0039C9EA1C
MPREYQYPFELRHLVYFREVARQLHFRKAAGSLAIAQPALSRAIAQLERAVGPRLLNRTRRGVELTPAGRLLLERIEPLLRGLAAIPRDLAALAGGQVGHVRVAFTGLAMATVLPRILREFHQSHPGIRLELTESPTSMQLAALQAGDIACGFFHPDAPTPGLRTRLLLRERNGVLLPASHALARDPREQLRLRDLAATPFVLFPRTHNPGFYDRILAAFSSAGVTPRIAEEIWPRANGIGLVRAGLGATFMTPSEAQHLPPEVAFRALAGPAPESRLVLGWRQTPAPEPALAAFLAAAGARAGDPSE